MIGFLQVSQVTIDSDVVARRQVYYLNPAHIVRLSAGFPIDLPDDDDELRPMATTNIELTTGLVVVAVGPLGSFAYRLEGGES